MNRSWSENLVLGSHVIQSTYGFWLPNDPRGSWSEYVAKRELLEFGEATKVSTRRSVAGHGHDRERRAAAKEVLEFAPVQFTGLQARAIGMGFGNETRKCGYTIWACAIKPEHTHLVVARHHYEVERIILRLKAAATSELVEQQLHPFMEFVDEKGRVPKCWAQQGWKVFLDSEEDILRSIAYVQNNPVKEGKPKQNWNFVTPYESINDNV